MEPTSYCTVAAPVVASIEERRSVFECWLRRVEDEASARAVVEEARSAHWDARHHCSAFVLGPEGALVRSNDDGEPAGTAGTPMLEVLTGAGLSDVVAVVTRWFGGTLLGTGGLARAYSDATSAVLDVAGVRERVLWRRATVTAPIAEVGSVESRLRRDTDVLEVDYGADRVTWTVAVADVGVLERLDVEELEPVWRDA